MSTVPRPFPPALPHGPLNEVLPGIFFVKGTLRMSGFLPVAFSRNMTVIKEGERLVIVNSVRLDDAGLAQLDALGRVSADVLAEINDWVRDDIVDALPAAQIADLADIAWNGFSGLSGSAAAT